MNRNRFRLVFDADRGMLIPVCEHMPARGKRGGKKVAALGAALVLGAGGFATGLAQAGSSVRAAGAVDTAAIARPPAGYVPPSSAFTPTTDGAYRVSGTYGQVDQAVQRAVFNWSSFDIGAGGHVHFNQPGNGSAINRIASANPSVIMGQLTATGQIYLINQNGVLFGNGARVNVGSLVASSLDISDSVFKSESGWFSLQSTSSTLQNPTFTYSGSADDFSSGKSFVRVENGAELSTVNGGGIYIFAPRVENAGKVSTPEGQTILAAGAKVYLAAPLDSRMRGFLVEVDPYVGTDGSGNAVNIGGSVSIERVGQILAERGGNITLAGLAVNHAGSLKATTTVDYNGSIIIKARDTAMVGAAEVGETAADKKTVYYPKSSRGGSVTLAAGSTVEVAPEKIYETDAQGKTVERLRADKVSADPSLVSLLGRDIVLEGAGAGLAGAQIVAHSGEVEVRAEGGILEVSPTAGDGSIFLGSGSRIDVSGLKNVAAPIERNIISIDLYGNELKDSPLQRNGVLRGKTVKIDLREGSTIASFADYIGDVQRGIDEHSAAGGKVKLRTVGDLVMREGASVDVSGGSIRYQSGDTGTSQLSWKSGSDSMATASSIRTYTAVTDATRPESGYLEGRNAGTATFNANRIAIAGELSGSAIIGPYQRQTRSVASGPYASDQYTTMATRTPSGGVLSLGGLVEPGGSGTAAKLAQDARIAMGAASLSSYTGDVAIAAGEKLQLDAGMLSRGGFSSLALAAQGDIEVAPGTTLTVQPKGEMTLDAGTGLSIAGTLNARGGKITLKNAGVSGSPQSGDIAVLAGARLDVSGTWTNDLQVSGGIAPTDQIVTSGGTVSISAGNDLNIASGAVVDASAGAKIASSSGKLSSTLGDAGKITLATGLLDRSDADAANAKMTLNGDLRAYAVTDGKTLFGKGGSLSLTASSIQIGGAATGREGELYLPGAFFQKGGFKDFTLNGRDLLNVSAGTRIETQPLLRTLAASQLRKATGESIDGFSTLAQAPALWRSAGSITLQSLSSGARELYGSVNVGAGAALVVDPKGSIGIEARNSIIMAGTATAPGGNITLALSANQGTDYFSAISRAIWLTPTSQLAAGGVFKRDPKIQSRLTGEVLAGGTVTVNAAAGYLVTQAGSQIDASGTTARTGASASSSGRSYVPGLYASAGGTIALSAKEGLLLDGSLSARAGDATASGGALSVRLDRGSTDWAEQVSGSDPALAAILDRDRALTLAGSVAAKTSGMTAGQALDTDTYSGYGSIGADRVSAGGFSSLTLGASERIDLSGSFALSMNRSLTLDTPNLTAAGANVTLTAGQTTWINSVDTTGTLRKTVTGGSGNVTLAGDLVDVAGYVATQNIGTLTLASNGDLRLRGLAKQSDGTLKGGLATGGNLALAAAQVYPTTMSDFELAIHNNDAGTISISRPVSPVAVGPVLSGAGKLTVAAPTIVQNGVLRAPFGQIDLRAEKIDTTGGSVVRTQATNGTITLKGGSVTSVSGAGLEVLLGSTIYSGQEWQYLGNKVASLPEKTINLTADNVITQAGATIDLSGGGDLKAYEFTPGRGGSKDVLDATTSTTTYAIVPSLGTTYAPYDSQIYSDSAAIRAGDRIKLLTASGYVEYTLLPARYALLPGAFVVTILKTQEVAMRPTTLADGSQLASAFKTTATAGGGSVNRDSAIYQVQISAADIARTQSAYTETYASQFFGAGRGTGDAGRLAINAGKQIQLDATVAAGFAAGHRGAELDIAANNLAVVAAGQSAGSGQVALQADKLASVNAESLLLGGLRSRDADGAVNIQVVAENVDIGQSGKAVTVKAGEVLAVAKDTVSLHSGSTVSGEGALAHSGDTVKIAGDGALLRAAAGTQSTLVRTSTSGAGATKGTLNIDSGATVSGKSLILDATLATTLNGKVAAADAATIGAKRISVGGGSAGDGVRFDADLYAQLGAPRAINLTSYTTIDVYGNAVLGGAGLSELTLQSAGLAGYANAGQTATIQADTVRINNVSGSAFSAAGTGSGTLSVQAGLVEFGQGSTTIQGYGSVNVNASEEIRLSGSSRKTDASGNSSASGHIVKGDLNLTAPRIAAAAGADQALRADGAVVTARSALAAGETLAAAGQGARIEISGSRVTHGGFIDLPASEISLAAKGSGSGDAVTLLSGSEIRAQGYARDFADVTVAYPAGTVRLSSEQGDVAINSGAVVDVTGTSGGSAGSIEVAATNGSLSMNGTLRGSAPKAASSDSAPRQGSFKADAKSLGDLNALNAALNSGGFSESRDFRQRNGDVVLGVSGAANGGEEIVAHNFTLSADTGSINVYNAINAGGDKGGRIELYANNGDLVLNNSARLRAEAKKAIAVESGTEGQGGDVLLGAAGTGAVRVKEGATIAVGAASGSAARGGTVSFRAERTASTDTNVLNVHYDANAGSGSKLADAVSGASQVSVEGVKVYDNVTELISGATSGTKLGLTSVNTQNNTDFSATRIADLAMRLGFANSATTSYYLRPGVEVRSTGDLTVSGAWDLTSTRYSGNAGVLTLRAAGNLNINQNIIDGLKLSSNYYLPSSGDFWSYRLVAGADRNGASPMTTVRGGAGSVNVGTASTAVQVRTATGNIDIAAAQDIALRHADSTVYTAGYSDATGKSFYTALTNTYRFGTTNAGRAEFAKNGGDIRLSAGRDIYSVTNVATTATTAGSKSIDTWIGRTGSLGADGTTNKATAWWSSMGMYTQGFGAFAGDLNVNAGGNIVNAAFVAPTSGYLYSTAGSTPDASALKEFGGGDVVVRASGNIDGTLVLAGKGQALIEAGGSVGSTSANGVVNYSHVALGDAQIDIYGRQGTAIDALRSQVVPTGKASPVYGNYYYYSAKSAAALYSAVGTTQLLPTNTILPSGVRAVALGGNLEVSGFTMAPAATGQLELLASGDIRQTGTVTMSDAAPTSVSMPWNGLLTAPSADASFGGHASTLLHGSDSEPVRVVADGTIVGESSKKSLVSAKKFLVQAGGDISDYTVYGQNLKTSDVSQVVAGGDIRFTTTSNSVPENGYVLGGPGQLQVVAGGTIDLANSKGIVTEGNLGNGYLPSEGASIMVLAGAQGLDWQQYLALPEYRDMLFSLLRDSGVSALNAKDRSLNERAFAALAAAFPGTPGSLPAVGAAIPSTPYKGDINLFFSQIKTERGGTIDLLAPGGNINAGLASVKGVDKKASELGVVAVDQGDIRAYSLGSFWVNQSRVMTLGGGDILLWSSYGDIDAGNGAKSAAAAPPARVRWDSKLGMFVLDASNSISGSGIRALSGQRGVAAGSVYLFAPVGSINAGEAGIGGSGVFIDAPRLIGTENINGSLRTGAEAPPAAPALVNVANAAVEANRSGEQDTQAGSRRKGGGEKQSLLNVEVISLGDDSAGSGGAEEKKKKN